MTMGWLDALKQYVEKRPMVVLNFDEDEWESLQESRRGTNEFTIARPHRLLEGVVVPTPCIFYGGGDDKGQLYFGLIRSRQSITTLESRIKIERAVRIGPSGTKQLLSLITNARYVSMLKNRLNARQPVVLLSPKLSSHLVERLVSIASNRAPMRAVAEMLSIPRQFQGNADLQRDAVRLAFSAFGLKSSDSVRSLELVDGRDTALAQVPLMEDSVIEHDARRIPGYDLVHSDVTGRAVFERFGERLEVFTANRRDLEHCFGVDLIYLNSTRRNIVMLQYKMLEKLQIKSGETDWIYRPDSKLAGQIAQMSKFSKDHSPGPHEYRLNPNVFFLKFVKRDGAISGGGIITPLDHFEKFRLDPTCKGPRNGLRVSFNSLGGCYLREGAFLDLVRSGYVGAYVTTTKQLMVLVEEILKGNRAVVAAIQKRRPSA